MGFNHRSLTAVGIVTAVRLASRHLTPNLNFAVSPVVAVLAMPGVRLEVVPKSPEQFHRGNLPYFRLTSVFERGKQAAWDFIVIEPKLGCSAQ